MANNRLTVRDIPTLGDVTFRVFNFDNVVGTTQDDRITGNDNDNIFAGLGGKDVLTGGAGDDIFVLGFDTKFDTINFYAEAGNDDQAVIKDFETGSDLIVLAGVFEDYAFRTNANGVTRIAQDLNSDGKFNLGKGDELIASITGTIDTAEDIIFTGSDFMADLGYMGHMGMVS